MNFNPVDGWRPHVLACTWCVDSDCPEKDCLACNGSGLQAVAHVLYDALIVDGELLATIERFNDYGAVYANVTDPQGNHQGRTMDDAAEAQLWAEIACGYRAARPISTHLAALGPHASTKRGSRAKARGRG